jgi:hypothetical protein
LLVLRSSQIHAMKTMTNGATLIKKGAAQFHKLLPRCKDHPALVDDAAKADALLLALLLLLLLLELVEPVVVVPVGGGAAGVLTAVEVMSVDVGVVTELEIERDEIGGVDPVMEFEDVDEVEAPETGKGIAEMAKGSLESPLSPNTRIQTRIL